MNEQEQTQETVQEPTVIDLVREKYRSAVKHPRSDVLSDDDLNELPPRDRNAILSARARRARQNQKRLNDR